MHITNHNKKEYNPLSSKYLRKTKELLNKNMNIDKFNDEAKCFLNLPYNNSTGVFYSTETFLNIDFQSILNNLDNNESNITIIFLTYR